MNYSSSAALTAAAMTLLANNAFASIPVPELDGSGLVLALGLVVGVAALIRERLGRK